MRLLFLLCLTLVCLHAQTPSSREEEIQLARQAKAKELKPEQASKPENFLRRFKDEKFLERFSAGWNGFRLKTGQMVTRSGFAIGPEYFREDLWRGQLEARAAAQFSTRGFYKLEGQATLPHLLNERLNLDMQATHRNYGRLDYYGPGPNSRRTGRSNFRLEDTSFDTIAGAQPFRHLKLGTSVGALLVNVGPGQDPRFISADKQYSARVTPGIDEQTNFLRYSVFSQLDFRDNPRGPKAGGNYVFQYSWYKDFGLERYSFRRMDVEAEQHLHFLNKTRRIVLRAKGTFTDTDGTNQTPFYLQPTIGGSDDLRGYRFMRFNDRNSVVYNAEYRWEVFSGLDGALFFDAGKVMPRRSLLAFSNLETSAGFGLRFNARNVTNVRLDVGFSQEGFQIWIKFRDILTNKKFGANTLQPAY
jgi:outer membrane protein assembly factor BamA